MNSCVFLLCCVYADTLTHCLCVFALKEIPYKQEENPNYFREIYIYLYCTV